MMLQRLLSQIVQDYVKIQLLKSKSSNKESLDCGLPEDVQAVNRDMAEILAGLGQIIVLAGKKNIQLFQGTDDFKSSFKLKLPGHENVTYFDQQYHGCLVHRDGRIDAVYLFVFHPEAHYHPFFKSIFPLMDELWNLSVALRGLPLSVNRDYPKWKSTKVLWKASLDTPRNDQVATRFKFTHMCYLWEKRTGNVILPEQFDIPRQDWDKKFEYDESSEKSLVDQMFRFYQEKGHATQEAGGWSNLVRGRATSKAKGYCIQSSAPLKYYPAFIPHPHHRLSESIGTIQSPPFVSVTDCEASSPTSRGCCCC